MTDTLLDGYDAIHLRNIPPDGHVVFFYTDGMWANRSDAVAVANGRTLWGISAIGTSLAPTVDCEPGCVWPPTNVVAWVRRARAAGIDPHVYVGRANWQAVIAQFQAEHEPEPHWHVAHYTNAPHLCSSACGAGYAWGNVGNRVAMATQYGGDLAGGYDVNAISPESLAIIDPIAAASLGATPIETPPATPSLTEVGMFLLYSPAGTTLVGAGYTKGLDAEEAGQYEQVPGIQRFDARDNARAADVIVAGAMNGNSAASPALAAAVQAVINDVSDDASAADVKQAVIDALAAAGAPSAPAVAAPGLSAEDVRQVVHAELASLVLAPKVA